MAGKLSANPEIWFICFTIFPKSLKIKYLIHIYVVILFFITYFETKLKNKFLGLKSC